MQRTHTTPTNSIMKTGKPALHRHGEPSWKQKMEWNIKSITNISLCPPPPPKKKKNIGEKKYLYTQRYLMRKNLQNLVWGQIQNFLGGQDHSAPVEVLFNFLISDHKQTFYLTFSSQTKSKSLISLFDLRKKEKKKRREKKLPRKIRQKEKVAKYPSDPFRQAG